MSSINHIRGNIFNSTMQTIVNTVNIAGFMGAGIALEYKRRFPEMYDEYNDLCTSGNLKIGDLHLWKNNSQWILNFPTKIHYSNPSKLDYIHKGLSRFKSEYRELGITSIAFPQLGTQLGGLDWENSVKPLMDKYLEDIDIKVEIYEYDPNADDNFYLKIRNILKNFSEKDFKEQLNIGKKTASNILESLDIEIQSMKDFEFVKGVGEESLKNIYGLYRLNTDDFEMESFQQTKLSFDNESPKSD